MPTRPSLALSSTTTSPSAQQKNNSSNPSPTPRGDSAALENNLVGLGFDEHSNSISTDHPEAHAAIVIIEAMREQTRQLAVLGLHTARLSRHFKETLKQLNDEQEKRRATEAREIAEAAALYQMDQKQGLPYNPAEDGFVFSNSEIETYIRRQTRLKAACGSAGC